MAVLQTKTEARCKICSSPHRAAIEALLEKRSDKVRDPVTRELLYSGDIVLAKLRDEYGIENPTLENISGHWKKHCEKVSVEEVADVEAALDEHREELLAILDETDGSVDGDLRVIFKLGIARIRGRVLRGEDPNVTTDQSLKAAAELTKRQDNEAKRDVLQALAGGIGLALTRGAKQATLPPGEQPEVIEQEPVEA